MHNPTYFIADPHFGHDKIRFMCNRPFETVEQMNRVLIENWNRLVGKRDDVYLLGDVFLKMTQKEALAIREQLNGNIHLILGNHDQIAKSIPRAWAWMKESYLFTTKEPDKIAIYLHHFAHRTWPKSHKGAWHLYGHSHGNLPDDPNLLSMDVGVDVWGFEPVGLSQVVRSMENQKLKREQAREFMTGLKDLFEQATYAHSINEHHKRNPKADPPERKYLPYQMQLDPGEVLKLINAARAGQPEVRA